MPAKSDFRVYSIWNILNGKLFMIKQANERIWKQIISGTCFIRWKLRLCQGENRYNEMNRGNRHHEIMRISHNVLSSKYQLSNRMGVCCARWYVYELQYSLKKRFICHNLLFTGNLLHTYCDDHISSWSCATSGLWSTKVISGDVMMIGSRRMYEETRLFHKYCYHNFKKQNYIHWFMTSETIIQSKRKMILKSEPVFYLWLSKLPSSKIRYYMYSTFSQWLRTLLVIYRKRSSIKPKPCCHLVYVVSQKWTNIVTSIILTHYGYLTKLHPYWSVPYSFTAGLCE